MPVASAGQGSVQDATRFLGDHAETQRRFERVTDLVEGFETPYRLELLSTVHWVVTREGAGTEEETVAAVHESGERKRRFTPEQIRLCAASSTAQGGWRPRSRPFAGEGFLPGAAT